MNYNKVHAKKKKERWKVQTLRDPMKVRKRQMESEKRDQRQ